MRRHRALPWLLIFGVIAIGLALNWPIAPEVPSGRNMRGNMPYGAPGMRSARRVPWRVATPRERQAAAASIVAQLNACKRNDFQSALFYQSALLRRRFPSPDAFRQMIQGYPQFARYKSVRFEKSLATPRGRLLQIEVNLTGMDNVKTRAIYLMVLENKIYRVGSVKGGRAGGKGKKGRAEETQEAETRNVRSADARGQETGAGETRDWGVL
ncbi:MAG: hypothetical protein JWN98_663 [Abditibacteriota bacterium]|nr:hypothetical protein [Abditibacteriota bacterium]